MSRTDHAVLGTGNGQTRPMILRRFLDPHSAHDYAQNVNMKYWDRIWVEEIASRPDKNINPSAPPIPWNVQWINGFAYLVAADGRKLASLLGPQAQREIVAGMIIDGISKPGD